MKKNILAMCSAVALSGLSLAAAQQPTPQPAPQTPPTQQTPPSQPAQRPPDPTTPSPGTRAPMSDMARSSGTFTGCLKTWDSRTMAPAAGAGSGAGSASSPASSAPSSTGAAAQYVLTNVEGATSRTAGKATSFLVKSSDPGVSFSQHLNHKVQLTGTLSDSGATSSSSTADRPTSDKPSTDRDASASGRVSADDMKLPTLNVTALKMVSPTCGTGS